MIDTSKKKNSDLWMKNKDNEYEVIQKQKKNPEKLRIRWQKGYE